MDDSEAPTHRNDPAGATGGIFATAHRPMFLLAALWAVTVIVWRYRGESGGPVADALGSPVLWHAHEMIFGFAGAAFAGYTLTAAPSWSRRAPASGLPVAVLTVLWIVTRIAIAGVTGLPLMPIALIATAFFVWLAALLAGEAISGRSAKGALQAVFAVLLGVADLAMILGLAEPRAAILIFALVLSVIGGRMVRALTENRVLSEGAAPIPQAAIAGYLGATGIVAALVADATGAAAIAGAALVIAAGAEALRLFQWQRAAVRHDALVLMLHLGFVWLPVGLALTGLALLGVEVLAAPDALHALTAGAMSCLIHAVAARAVARRTPERLVARWPGIIAFAFVWLAACLRLAEGSFLALSPSAAMLWVVGWSTYLITLIPSLRGAPQRPVFSGPRA
ncbi:NnrS family protein [Defluviimonas aestuarii]|uniref:NnrS family protein n=1 Tax=Albidovulum aestuarii TaxID=1130726 RepID=UPI00249CC405|nr:NnrS family protein [Defluviimonas aestuarii]MDI3337510.1 NnrS family protein [Defluviimonas aestuarii]